MNQGTYIDQLIAKLEAGNLSDTELKALVDWYNSFDDSQIVLHTEVVDSPEALKARMYQRLMAQVKESHVAKRPLRRPWLRYAAAAVLLLSVSIGLWFYGNSGFIMPPDITAGGNRATLTLADGRKIDLSDAKAGIVVGDGITYVDGSAVIENKGTLPAQFAALNSLTTPKGGTYQITLPDGSSVWLNANSTLKYPSRFDGNERVVELEGEAYFDVSHQASLVPFLVKTDKQTVEVLGTEFNVSAYSDDPETQTTLVEGRVRVATTADHRPHILAPGQQAVTLGKDIETKEVDIEPYIAWKNGHFLFDNTPLSTIADQLAKWYDIRVVFKDPVQSERFYGMIDRGKNLSQVLKMLEKTQTVRFKLQTNTLYITKR